MAKMAFRGGGMLFGANAQAVGAAPEMMMMNDMVVQDAVPEMMMMQSAPVRKPIEVRKTFPETWLFDSLEFDSK